MTLLLVVALTLAWPTFGLSLVVYFVVFVLRGVAHAQRTRLRGIFDAAMAELDSASECNPSWITHSPQTAAFIAATTSEARRQGVPLPFITRYLRMDENKDAFIKFVGLVEERGGSVREQGIAATQYLCEAWKSKDTTVAAKQHELQTLMSDMRVQFEVNSILANRIFMDDDASVTTRVEECLLIARHVASLTGHDSDKILSDALAAAFSTGKY